jgi:uncharacterized protein (DUF2164 family)
MSCYKAPVVAAQAETVYRHVGNCQLCEGDFKLTSADRMVHHGYKRPGDGSIHGDCPAVDALPYEMSCELINSYVAGLRLQLEAANRYLVKLESGAVTYLTDSHIAGYKATRRVVTVEFVAGVSAPYCFDRALRDAKQHIENTIQNLESSIERCDKRIAAWEPVPTRIVSELVAKAQEEKDARKAERAAAKAVRDAKKAATTAKMAALRQKRQEAFNAFEAKIIAAAKLPTAEHPGARATLRAERRLNKNTWMWGFDHSTEAGAALMALGMGHYGHNNIVYMSFPQMYR